MGGLSSGWCATVLSAHRCCFVCGMEQEVLRLKQPVTLVMGDGGFHISTNQEGQVVMQQQQQQQQLQQQCLACLTFATTEKLHPFCAACCGCV